MSIPTIDLSIVIVSYNQLDLVWECLDSVIREAGDITYEIILVDNSSMDGTTAMVAERFPSVHIIRNERNRGFAAANNQGIMATRGRHVFLLNQDARIVEGPIARLVRIMDEYPRIGILGCKVIFPDGVLQPTYNPPPALWRLLFPDRDRIEQERRLVAVGQDIAHRRSLAATYARRRGYEVFHEVPNVSGVAMLVRAETHHEVGLLDERFFMYYEDLDWCVRAVRVGWGVFYTPDCTVCHHWYGGLQDDRKANPRRDVAAKAQLAYFRKHRPVYEAAALGMARVVQALIRARLSSPKTLAPLP